MAKYQQREFEIKKAVREGTALIIGLAGETGTGKTVSALRLATGMAKVLSRRIAVVDTEAKRALNYADEFDFDHIDFAPPFGPLDYISAIDAGMKAGAGIIVVDSMSHEHNGDGGIMDQIDRFLDEKCGDDELSRQKWNQVAHAKIKPQRKKLNQYIVQLGRTGVILILCYRASDKTKPEPGKGIRHLGFVPETTSPLRYEMTQAFLLLPGAKGKPCLNPETNDEKIWNKTPMQFEGWVKDAQLDETLGAKFAKWATGGKPSQATAYESPFGKTRMSTDGAQAESAQVQTGPDISEPCPMCKVNAPRCKKCDTPQLFRAAEIHPKYGPRPGRWYCPRKCTPTQTTIKATDWHAVLHHDQRQQREPGDDAPVGATL